MLGIEEAIEFIAMKRGIAAAIGADKTFIQKVYKLGAGMPGLVVSDPVELAKVRRHDLLFTADGEVYEVVKAPNEESRWRTDWPNEVVVYSQAGETLTFSEGWMKDWGWISFAEAKGESNG